MTKSIAHALQDPYRTWRHGLGIGAVYDIDQMEIGWIGTRPVPLAIIETTEFTHLGQLPAILRRINEGQGAIMRMAADHLQVPAYLVAFNASCDRFFVHSLTNDEDKVTWREKSALDYSVWLKKLRDKMMEKKTHA